MLLGFRHCLSLLPEGSLHHDILRDNIADAKGPLPRANWAEGIDRQLAIQGMASPIVSSGIHTLGSHVEQDGSKPAEGLGRLACVPQDHSFQRAHIIIGLVALIRSAASLTMSCLLPGLGHWCNSGLVRMLCLWSRAGMPGLPSLVTFACAIFVAPRCWR